jgi:exopolysaccharide biosynthesis predicted pyruvyltransferase EpsI
LTIVAREPQSYKLIKKYFDKVNIIETPDIVLSLELALEEFPREGIITLLRDDKEKKEMPQISSLLVELSKQFEISTSDTHLGENFFERIDHQNRKSILNEKWKEIAQHKLVITDRLHGMIFSYITKTPCIVFSNSNYKIRETYKKYLSESKSIMFIENMDDSEIISIVKELISKPFDSIENFENNYTILEKIIKGE